MRKWLLLSLSVLVVLSCSTQRRIAAVRRGGVEASVLPSGGSGMPEIPGIDAVPAGDTLIVHDDDGHDMIIMRAVKDEYGEMVAHDVIDAAVVTAKFRNVAERHGQVDIRFMVTVPSSMLDSRWQIRLAPEMTVQEEAVGLDPIIITGKEYRKAQLKGYQQYNRFIESIITDTTQFIWMHELEVFLHRNIPDLFLLKTDSTYVSDEQFSSIYGVTQRQAVEHYTNQIAAGWNRKKVERKDRMFDRYIKVPILTEGLRLDSVLTNTDGDFIYEYTQTINASPGLRKVDVTMSGGIYEEDKNLYGIPESGPISFYISSLSSLCSDNAKYITRIIERRLNADATYWIDFEQGKYEINTGYGNNAWEIRKIKDNLAAVMDDREYDLDSITVTASCSPEGSLSVNDGLSRRRSEYVSSYFDRFCREYRDSVAAEEGIMLSLGDVGAVGQKTGRNLKFISQNIPENWDYLKVLVCNDTVIHPEWKNDILQSFEISDLDERERTLSTAPCYQFLSEFMYPQLRTVRFDFHLHRKGMVKDTVHTTVLDTVYMRGVQAIKDRDYKEAVSLLRPYRDYNTAVAFCCLDYNESALEILEGLEETPEVDYLMAVILSRKGLVQEAVQHYLDACRKDASLIHRGNLDPEISELIKTYNLDFQ